MVTEVVYMSVVPGQESGFEAALAEARVLVETSAGCRGLRVLRGVERPSVYLIAIDWDDISDHMQGFRESERFGQWRGLLGPFFAEPPLMEHFSPTA